MALQFDVDIAAAEALAELVDGCGGGFDSAVREGMGERTFVAAGEADEARRAGGDFFGRDVAFAFFCAQFHARDQAAEVLVTRLRFDEQGIAPAFRRGDFGTDMGLERELFGGEMEARGAVDAVAVKKRHGPHAAGGANGG